MGSMPLSLGLVVLSLCDVVCGFSCTLCRFLQYEVIRALTGSCIWLAIFLCRAVSGLPYGFLPSSRCPYLLLLLSFKDRSDFACKCDCFFFAFLLALDFYSSVCRFLAILSGLTRSFLVVRWMSLSNRLRLDL
jgi:hypothetical protein